MIDERLLFQPFGNDILVYDQLDPRDKKSPVAIVRRRYLGKSRRYVYTIYLDHVYHSRHVDQEHAIEMLRKLFPLRDTIEWLNR